MVSVTGPRPASAFHFIRDFGLFDVIFQLPTTIIGTQFCDDVGSMMSDGPWVMYHHPERG